MIGQYPPYSPLWLIRIRRNRLYHLIKRVLSKNHAILSARIRNRNEVFHLVSLAVMSLHTVVGFSPLATRQCKQLPTNCFTSSSNVFHTTCRDNIASVVEIPRCPAGPACATTHSHLCRLIASSGIHIRLTPSTHSKFFSSLIKL